MKPVVYFTGVVSCEVGLPALVFPYDHPSEFVSNRTLARTSLVKNKVIDVHNRIIQFETENTIYKRLEQ